MTDYIHDVAIDTESFLEATLQEPVCCASDNADNFVDLLVEHGLVSEDSKQELVDAIDNKAQWACEILDVLDAFGIEYTDHGRDNTYNQENDLSSDFIWQVVTLGSDAPSDWIWSDNPLTFVFIDKHEGGDPRGNYGPWRIHHAEGLGDSGFFDWQVGWHVADRDGEEIEELTERCSVGYAQCPTHELCEQLVCDKYDPVGGWFDKQPLNLESTIKVWRGRYDGVTVHATPYTYHGEVVFI